MAPSRPPLPAARARRLRALERRYHRLRQRLAAVGYLAPGTLTETRLRCGKPACACHRSPRRRHGPYVYWTSKVKGRTVSRLLKPAEARLYREWIRNRQALDRTVREMMEVSKDAAVLLLPDDDPFIPGR